MVAISSEIVDSSVITEPAESIFNLINVVVTKHFFVFSYETVKFIPNTLHMQRKNLRFALVNTK